MQRGRSNTVRELLRELQRRVPAGPRFVQEAFTSDHRHPVMIKLNDLRPDTFYVLDEITTCALCDAIVEWTARHGGGRLTVSYSAFGEWRAQQKRLQHLASKFAGVRVLAVGAQSGHVAGEVGLEVRSTVGTSLTKFRIAMREGRQPVLFVAREAPSRTADQVRYLGFFTTDAETVDEVAEDIDVVARGLARRMASFERLQMLHQTTQRVTRELESYSRRMELAIRRAQRRPDLLTPARFDRIVRQSIAKIEQLKEIPRRALRTLGPR
jgi:hypothetical protein